MKPRRKTKLRESANLSTAGLRAFFEIGNLWKLNTQEQKNLLGLTSDATYYKWKKDPNSARLSKDTLERLSYIVGIYKALQMIFPNEERADQWIRRPNRAALFGGKSALERMLEGKVSDLFLVRQYLDAQLA